MSEEQRRMKSYTLGGGGIDFFHLTLEQQLALHEWVMANGFAINWVNRLDVTRARVVVHVFVFHPDGKGGFVRKINAADGGLETVRHRVSSKGFPHPDLAESLRGAWVINHEYANQLAGVQAKQAALLDLCERRGYALERMRKERDEA